MDALECHFSESLTSPESLTFTNSSVNLRFNKRFRRLPLWISGSKFSLSVCSPFKKALILLRNEEFLNFDNNFNARSDAKICNVT